MSGIVFDVQFNVVVNGEGQYSIWPAFNDLPAGWFDATFSGSKEQCLAHIKEVWTDLRPKSLRETIKG
jgi:MbtH protein